MDKLKDVTGAITICLLVVACSRPSSEQEGKRMDVLPDGSQLFVEHCAACHGRDGTLQKAGSKDLTAIQINFDEIKHVIEQGTDKGMPRFKEVLGSSESIDAVASHVLGLQQKTATNEQSSINDNQ